MSLPAPRSFRRRLLTACLASSFTTLAGCHMGVPIHIWSPPQLSSAVGKSVLIPKITGPPEVAESLHERLLASIPKDAGRQFSIVASESLAPPSSPTGIALVSYEPEDESDLAVAAKARREGIDFILRGEVIPDRVPKPIEQSNRQLRVSWRLTPLSRQDAPVHAHHQGRPIVFDLESALEQYPDLAILDDKQDALESAVVRETLPLITPWIDRRRVQLAIPYVFPGSRDVRKGNLFALAGRWQDAERQWQAVADRHWFASAAVHNLAIAAVARQDFATARKLARKAIRMNPTPLHKSTLVWIEQVQRDYHDAFHLPDPPDGWFLTRE